MLLEVQTLRERLSCAISERRLAEEALRAETALLSSILDSMGDGLIVADVRGRFVLCNPAADRIAGIRRWDIPPELWTSEYGVFLPDGVTPYPPEELPLARAIRGESVDQVEMVVRPAGAEEGRYLSVTARPLRDNTGVLLGGVVVFRDVTRQRREENLLRQSEARFHAFMDNSPAVAFLKDEQGQFVYLNRPYQQSFQAAPGDWLGKTVAETFPAETARQLQEHDALVRATGKPVETYQTVPAPDGSLRDWLILKFPVDEPSGRRFLGGVAVDVTEQRRAEKAVREINEMFRSLIRASPLAIIALDEKSHVTMWNPAAERIFGWREDETLGRPLPIVSPEKLDEFRALRGDVLQGKVLRGLELRRRRKDKTLLDISIWTAPVRDASGVVRSTIGIVADITERKRAEAQLLDYAERLRTLSRRLLEVQEAERRHLARELHDEVGQLLTGLKLTMELAARLPPSEFQAGLAEARAMVRDLTAHVRDLSLRLRPTMLDDLGLLPALLWHFQRYTAQTRVRVAFEHRGAERRFPPEVETAAYRLVQEALTNVARHAGVSEVTVRVWLDRNQLCVQVEDRGAGFDLQAVRNAGTSGGISGMEERAALLDGVLTIESAQGKGTRLTVELPVGDTTESAPVAGSHSPP